MICQYSANFEFSTCLVLELVPAQNYLILHTHGSPWSSIAQGVTGLFTCFPVKHLIKRHSIFGVHLKPWLENIWSVFFLCVTFMPLITTKHHSFILYSFSVIYENIIPPHQLHLPEHHTEATSKGFQLKHQNSQSVYFRKKELAIIASLFGGDRCRSRHQFSEWYCPRLEPQIS